MTKLPAGQCRCGAVQFSVLEAPNFSVYCHCEDCRQANAAPVVAFVGFMADKVEWQKDGYKTFVNGAAKRLFCGNCGSPIAFCHDNCTDRIFFYTTIMENPENYPPVAHTFAGEQLPWLRLEDDLPRHPATLIIDFTSGKNQ